MHVKVALLASALAVAAVPAFAQQTRSPAVPPPTVVPQPTPQQSTVPAPPRPTVIVTATVPMPLPPKPTVPSRPPVTVVVPPPAPTTPAGPGPVVVTLPAATATATPVPGEEVITTVEQARAAAAAAAARIAAEGAQAAINLDNLATVQGVPAYPNMPTVWPDPNESRGAINIPELLKAPLVVAGMAKVTAAVSPALLEIPPSLHTDQYGRVWYTGNTAQNCHWPSTKCHTPDASVGVLPDITSCPAPNTYGLTYDDGPSNAANASPSSLDLLTALAQQQQKATFFVVGGPIVFAPEALVRMYAEGHEIAVHSWTHSPLTTLTNEQIVAEILYTEALIYKILGVRPRYFRPPYGDVDNRVRAIIGALGYESILWTDVKDTMDTSPAQFPTLVTNVQTWFVQQPGFIALQHSLSGFNNKYAIDVLNAIGQAKTLGTFPLKVQAIGECLGTSPYVNAAAVVPLAATGVVSLAAATSTVAPAAIATPVAQKPTVVDTSASAPSFRVVGGALAGAAALAAAFL